MSKAKERTEPPKNQSKIKSRIREVAEKQGIKSSYGLQMLLSTGEKIVAPTVAVNLWNDDVTRFSVETLELLCEKLSCDVGELLVYESNAKRSKPVAVPESVKGAPVKVGYKKPADVFRELEARTGKKSSDEFLPDEDFAPSTSASDNEFSHSVASIVSGGSVVGSGELLSTHQVAERLGVSRKSVNDYIVQGKLPAVKGKQGHNFISIDDVLIFEAVYKGKS